MNFILTRNPNLMYVLAMFPYMQLYPFILGVAKLCLL